MHPHLNINNKIEEDKVLKVTAFKKSIRKTTPHKHNNYFEIVYLFQGNGYHFIDWNKYAIKPPIIFFIRQEQVHYWDMTSEPRGYVVIIKKLFIDQSLDSELKSLLTRMSSKCCLQLSDTNTIEKLLELLTTESNENGGNHFQITEGQLKSILSKLNCFSRNKPFKKRDDQESLITRTNKETAWKK